MPIRSPFPDINIPNVSIWEFLLERKSKPFPDDKVIYRDAITNRTYNYTQVKSTSIAFGNGLKSRWRWQKGDVLALFSPNCIDIPSVIWGTLWTGGVVSPMNPLSTVSELGNLLKDCGAKGLVTQKCCLDNAIGAAQIAGLPLDRIVLIGDERDEQARAAHWSSLQVPVTGGWLSRSRPAAINPKTDMAFLVYSSGTTGLPKAVMLTHENIVSNALMVQATEKDHLSPTGGGNGEGDKVISILPFFHIYGFALLILQPLYVGIETIVMARFELDKFCENIQRHKITVAYLVPPIILLLAKHPLIEKYDLSSLQKLMSAAAPLTKDLIVALYKRLKIPVKQGYGLSETSPGTCIQRWADWDSAMGSVGTLLPNQIVKMMSADEREVSPGEVGEIWVKGPNIFKGYLNNEEGTRNCMTDDGFFKTGDIGYQDANGNFYITDRVKELIKYKGFQVAPAQIEGYLLGHPDVDDVAVIGVYVEDQATEVPRAYIVLRKGVEGNKATAEAIIEWLNGRVANHKKLRGGVRFVKEIPKSATGKILRRVLKSYVEEEKQARL